jgi:hypothetical protein
VVLPGGAASAIVAAAAEGAEEGRVGVARGVVRQVAAQGDDGDASDEGNDGDEED